MNKGKEWLKEVVGKLNLVVTEFEADGMCYMDRAVSVMQVYDLIDQLDEPEQLVVPKFAADWYEENEDDLEFEIFNLVTTLGEKGYDELTDLEAWFNNFENGPIETFMRMKLFGYEVEKEKLYYVINDAQQLMLVNAGYAVPTLADFELVKQAGILKKYQLTEEEIKKYDERYWSFALEVSE